MYMLDSIPLFQPQYQKLAVIVEIQPPDDVISLLHVSIFIMHPY